MRWFSLMLFLFATTASAGDFLPAVGRIDSVAGTGEKGYDGDGGPATKAKLNQPFHVELDGKGNLYVAEANNHCIRKVDLKTGLITTVAGNGKKGYTGDGGPATKATFNEPYAVVVDKDDNLFIVDRLNAVVRKVDGKTGIVTTVAGTGVKGYSGDGEPGNKAQLKEPNDCHFDGKDGLLIADVGDWRIRRLDLKTGIISTFAGTGRPKDWVKGKTDKEKIGDGGPANKAVIVGARAVCIDHLGNTYICEREGSSIRKVDPKGIITTIGGTGQWGYKGDGFDARLALFAGPKGIRCDKAGNLFIVDTEPHAIRRIDAKTNVVTTVAGGRKGPGGDGDLATKAGMGRPHGAVVAEDGTLYVADSENHRVRRVKPRVKDDYPLGPDSMEQPNVLKGEMLKFVWESKVFPKTVRDVWVYVPAQYDGKTPAHVLVVQDGPRFYADRKSQFRLPVVLDNLIHKKELPVTIAIFIDPGSSDLKGGKNGGPDFKNRSFEYDTPSPQYAEFLEKEILPEVGKKFSLRQDADGRAIAGISSGGICAFTVAWERPDLFNKVLSHVGSFTNIRGGDIYPGKIRKTPEKPIRIFLQGGANDLDNEHGHWPYANQQMAKALRYKGYDYRFEFGDGQHNGKHGGAILPDSLRWLFRPKEPVVKEQNLKPLLDDTWAYSADSEVQPGVPPGKIETLTWKSEIFPGTTRQWAIYVPAQYDPKTPTAFMVFQDGIGALSPKGAYRVPTVFDNLIHKKEIPVMIGIFVNPGLFEGKDPKKGGSNRSFEYDTLSDQYVRFLEKEILPEVAKKYNLSSDPARRGIAGSSSGGICAFTAAWQRPELFGKVLSHVGSFQNIRGGDRYPGIIRKTEKKPIRVLLQDGTNDLDNDHGNWPLGNYEMAAALQYKGYDYRIVWGEGGQHNGKHAGSILPDSLRWLWREK